MTNPLTDRASTPTGSFGRDLMPGEERVVTTREGKSIVIVRTSRPYAFDLCDAYNAAMSHEARGRGLEWYVDGGGNLRIGHSAAFTRQNLRRTEQRRETEQSRALQRSFEAVS